MREGAPTTATFGAADREAAFRSAGHVVVPLVAPAVAQRLGATLLPLVPAGSRGMVFSDHALTSADRRRVRAQITDALGAALATVLVDHRIVSAAFVAKQPGADGDMAWHVDPAVTDEERFRSVSVWVPLGPVGADDGALEVLAGGHRGAPVDRGGLGLLTRTHPPHDEVLAACRAAGGRPSGPLAVPLGSGLAYDHGLPHRSGPNRGAAVRLAVNVGLVPRRAPLRLHLWSGPGAVRVVPIADDTLTVADLGAPPEAWPGATTA